MNITEIYICPKCEKNHDDTFDAMHCCQIEHRYKCGACSKVHVFDDDAQACCADKEPTPERCTKTVDMFT